MEEEEIGKPVSKKTVATSYDDRFKIDPRVRKYLDEKNKNNPNNIKIEAFNASGNKDYLEGWENPHTIYGGTGDINSNDPFNEIRSINQGSLNKLGKLPLRVSTKILAEVSKIPGYVGGLAGGLYGEASDAITGKNEYSFTEQAFNNSWIKGVSQINENVNQDLLPIYVKKSVKDGNLWDNISSIDFWATEGADGIGFMASMLVPGAILKSLGLGAKLARTSEVIASIGSKGTKFQKLMSGAQKAAKLGLNTENFDMIGATVANTYLEAAAEAGMAIDSFEKENKNEFIDNALASGKTIEQAEQEFNTQKAILGKNMFVSNVALLTIPNGIQSAMMFGKGASKFMAKYGTKEFLKNSGKRIVGSTFSEGFVEEASQTTVENYFKEKAKKNNLKGDGLFSFDDFDPKGLKEAYLDTISSVDGQKAIFLGGVLGSSMSVYQGRKEDIYNKKESDKATSLTERYEQTLHALTDTKGNVSYDYHNNPIVSNKEIIAKFRTIDALSDRFDEYDKALESGDEETLEKVRNKTIQDVVLPFVKQGELGIEALTNYYDKMLESEDVLNSEDYETIKERKEEVIKTAESVSKKYDFYTNFINKRFNIPIKAKNKEEQKTLDLLKAQYFDKLSSSYALAEMEKEQVQNKLKNVDKELEQLNKIHGLNEVTTDELINEYVHNTDTTESFTNKKKDNFASKNEEYKKLLDYKNRLQDKLKETNLEISENYFDNKKINNDFSSKEKENIEDSNFEKPEITENEKIDSAVLTNEVAEVEKGVQNLINESLDDEGNPTISQEEFNTYMEQQDIPEEVKDAVVLLNEDQVNTLPTQEVIDNKVELVKTELEGVDEKDITEDDSIHKEEDEDVANSFTNIEVITPKSENNSLGHKIQNFFNNFINFEKQPRDKTKDKVTFSLGDFINNDTVKDIWDNFLKTGKIDKSGIKWLEEYLPIKVTLTNGKEEGSSFLKSKKGSPNFESYELPLRKAIVKALIENKGDFTKFEGSVQGQGKGKLNLDNTSTQNNVLDISILKGMKKPELLKYLKENTYIVNHDKQLIHAETGQKSVESFFNVIKSFHSGDVFLVFTRPNGQKVPIKLNNKRISNEKAGATVKLLSLLSNVIRTNQSDTILNDKDFKTFLKEKIGEESYNQLESEINLSKKNNNNERLREILEYITYSQNNNEISKLFVDNQGNLTVGRLLQKVNEDLQNEGSINYDMNLSSIGFTGFAGQNIDALINDELDENEQARFNHLVNFIRYKKSNIIASEFENDAYIEHVFGIDNKEALVSTNVSIDKDMFEGYSDIFLNNEVTTLEDGKTKAKELKEIENTEIPLAKEVVYNEPTTSNQSDIEAKADIERRRQEGTNARGTTYKGETTEKDRLKVTKYSEFRSDGKRISKGGRIMTPEEFIEEYNITDQDFLDSLEEATEIRIYEVRVGEGGRSGISIQGTFPEGNIEMEVAGTELAALESPQQSNEESKKADIERRRQEELIANIYAQLGDKTVSRNVILKSVYQQAGINFAKSIGGIFSLRVNNSNKHFGNPFSSVPSEIAKGLIATKSTKESVEKYIGWVLFSNEERAKWIREQIKSGNLKNKPIIYYKELGEPSHATALDYLINAKYDAELAALEGTTSNIVSASFTGQGTTLEIEIKGEKKDFLLTWNRNNTNPTLWGNKKEDGSYTTTDSFPSKEDIQKLVDKYVPIKLLNLINEWTNASKLPAEKVLDAQAITETKINAELKELESENNSENTRIIENNFVSLSKMDNITNIRDKNKMIEFAKENLDFVPKSLKTSENFEQLKQEYSNSEALNKQVDKICGL